MLLVACGPSANREALIFDGGSVSGSLARSPARYSAVAIERLDGEMAKATTIQLADSVRVSMAQVTPEFLLKRGRVFVPRGGEGGGFDAVQGLSSFDPTREYFVIVGPPPHGPFYRFDVKGGKPVTFGTEWPGGFLEDGKTLPPGPVFVDRKGTPHELPLTLEAVESIWGVPVAKERLRSEGR